MYQGKDGFIWFYGIVEDRNDPLYLNRVRVRIFGAHDHDKQKIATPDLPWSDVMMPTTSPSLSGMGTSKHGLVEGSTVMGFYRDGKDQQDPVVIGSFVGIPQSFSRVDETIDDKGNRSFTQVTRKPSEGFNDPRLDTESSYEGTPDGPNPQHINRNTGLTLALDKSPRKSGQGSGVSYPKEEYLQFSDVNFLAQGDHKKYPIINLAKGEPDRDTYVQPVYPFNNVYESESGHVIEIDDTPDYERLHLFHRTGTRVEVDKDGTTIEKIVRNKYTLILGENKVKIQGAVDIEVGQSIAGNAIAAGGGVSKLSSDSVAEVIDAAGKFSDVTKTKLKDIGITDEQIAAVEKVQEAGEVTAELEAELESAGISKEQIEELKKEPIVSKLGSAIDSALSIFEDVEGEITDIENRIMNNAPISAIISLVEGVSEGNPGVESIIAQVSEAVPGLPTEALTSLTNEFNTLSNIFDNPTSLLTSDGIDALSNSVTAGIDSAKSLLSNIPGVSGEQLTKVSESLNNILGSASAGIESMTSVVTEKVSSAVTSVFGERAGEVVSEQMSNAISGAALGAIAGALGSALVNISVAGGAKIKTLGSANLISLGSINATATTGTNITTLAGATTVTTLAGALSLTAPTGPITITSPIINTTGVLNHIGAMNITGILTQQGVSNFTGLMTGTAITAPVIQSGAAFLASHTHPIPTGSSAGSTLIGVG